MKKVIPGTDGRNVSKKFTLLESTKSDRIDAVSAPVCRQMYSCESGPSADVRSHLQEQDIRPCALLLFYFQTTVAGPFSPFLTATTTTTATTPPQHFCLRRSRLIDVHMSRHRPRRLSYSALAESLEAFHCDTTGLVNQFNPQSN